jgi:tRNA-binding EMAP/Myf-like protein
MHTWFECKIKYEKTIEEGKVANVGETYLVDALSFTEAEARIIKEMTPFISGEFEVANIRRMRISEMFPGENADKWYRCKVNYITLDEEKGVEKRTAVSMLVQANDLKEACEALIEGMKGTLADYEIASIAETTIMDVYPYEAAGNEEE